LLKILKDPGIGPKTRAELIGDFAQIKRTDLKPLFEEHDEKGELISTP
jgi:5'-3' exonuclease